jgi:hypothetical protein
LLSTAEALLGLSRHLSAYTGQPRADLGELEFAGQILELAVRLQGSGVSQIERVAALGLDAGFSKRLVTNDLLPTMELLGLVDLERNASQQVQLVSERVPPLEDLFTEADRVLAVCTPDQLQMAALHLLNETVRMPITLDQAMSACEGIATEEAAHRAIEDLHALRLCARQISDDGVVVLFNPNVWVADREYITAALLAEDGKVKAALSGLLEEVTRSAGMPEEYVESCDKKWIDFAVSQGLVLRSLVRTASGQEKSFLFTPHMGKSAFADAVSADPSGHVRQLIGSMVFANRFASNQLWSPVAFLRRLINEGEAGDASNIATDYSMLETAGIVRVEPAQSYSKFVLLQPDVASEAILHLNSSVTGNSRSGGLREQRSYRYPEIERAVIGQATPLDPSPRARASLIAALRQEAGRRRYGQ